MKNDFKNLCEIKARPFERGDSRRSIGRFRPPAATSGSGISIAPICQIFLKMYKHEAPPDRATTDRIQNRAVFPSFLVPSGRYPSAVCYAFRTTTLPIPLPVAPTAPSVAAAASEWLSRDDVGKLVQAIAAWQVQGRCFREKEGTP